MWAWILKIIGNIIIKSIKRKIDLKKIDKYVNQPNDLDKEVKKMKKELKKLRKMSHPIADFVCTKCGTKAKRINKIKRVNKVKNKLNKLKEKF